MSLIDTTVQDGDLHAGACFTHAAHPGPRLFHILQIQRPVQRPVQTRSDGNRADARYRAQRSHLIHGRSNENAIQKYLGRSVHRHLHRREMLFHQRLFRSKLCSPRLRGKAVALAGMRELSRHGLVIQNQDQFARLGVRGKQRENRTKRCRRQRTG